MKIRSLLMTAVALHLLWTPGLAHADDTQKRAAAAYESGDYDTAAELFERAYNTEAGLALLFGWAQSERLRGNCAAAIELYDKLLADTTMGPKRRNAVERAKERPCIQKVPVEPAVDEPAEAEPDAEPEPFATPATPAPAPAPAPHWYQDKLGHALFGLGVVAGATGGYLMVRSANTRDNALDQPTLPLMEAMHSRAKRDRAIAIGALSAGGALAIGAVVRYATGSTRSSTPVEVAATPTNAGATLILTGRF